MIKNKLILFIFCYALGGQAAPSLEAVLAKSMPSVATLLAEGPRGPIHGTAFVVDKKGLILTSYHLLKDAVRITLTLKDAEPTEAKVVGFDTALDLALLEIHPPSPLTPLPWAEEKSMAVGSWVLAIGNPYGLGLTPTVGILGATHRKMPEHENMGAHYLQTDAAMHLGSSGGPLLNTRGEVLGVLTFIFSASPYSQGLGFALSGAQVQKALKNMRTFG